MSRLELAQKRLPRLMTALRLGFGGCCVLCTSKERLEFAHIQPNGVTGKGRGGNRRAYHIRANPDHYRLLCRRCHLRYDRFVKRCLELQSRVTGRWYLGQRKEG